jgi:sugar phosphate permease
MLAEVLYGRRWGVVALLCVIAALNYVDRTAISTVLPLLRADLRLSDVHIAAIGTCFLWSYALGCPFAGWLADRHRRARVVFWSLLLWSAVTAATSFVTSVPQLLFLRALLGIVESAYLPAAIALIGDYHGPKTRGTAMGLHIAGLNFGVVAGGATVGFLGAHIGWRSTFLSMGAIGGLLAVFTWFYLRDPVWPPTEKAGARAPSSFALFRIPSAVVVAGEMAIVSMATWVFLNWLPLYFSEVHHLSLAGAGFSGTFFLQMPAALGMGLGGFVSDRLGGGKPERRMLILGLGLLASAPFLFAFNFPLGVASISACLLAYSLLRSLGSANEEPILCDLLEPRERATAFGIINGANNIAGGAAVLASGYIKQSIGLAGLFTITFFVVLASALLCLYGYHRWMHADLRAAAERVPTYEL